MDSVCQSFRQEVMSAAKAQQICQTLAQNALDQSRKTDAQHIKNLKKYHGTASK